jgi:hypothetical protein
MDDEDDFEDVAASGAGAAGAGAAVVFEDEVSLGETGATAGRSGMGVTCGAGAATLEDGGWGVGAADDESLDS